MVLVVGGLDPPIQPQMPGVGASAWNQTLRTRCILCSAVMRGLDPRIQQRSWPPGYAGHRRVKPGDAQDVHCEAKPLTLEFITLRTLALGCHR